MSKTVQGTMPMYRSSAITLSDNDSASLALDAAGNLLASLATLIAGEDLTNNVLKVEQRFSYAQATADVQVKSGAGFVHSITISQADVAPTAGTITLYDSLTEANTIIFQEYVTTGVFSAHSCILDVSFSTGLYLGFNGPADVNVTVSYR